MTRRSESPAPVSSSASSLTQSGRAAARAPEHLPGASVDQDFRRSLLTVLIVDLALLLGWLAWSRRASNLALLAVLGVVLPLGVTLAVRKNLRRTVALLVKRDTKRRHIIVPVAACVVLASLGFRVGGRIGDLARSSAMNHLGPVDELIVSPTLGARNAAIQVIAQAKQRDPRVGAAIDDLLPMVLADGAMQIGDRKIPVTIAEIDTAVAPNFGRRPSQTGIRGFGQLAAGEVGVPPLTTGVSDAGTSSVASLSANGVVLATKVRPLPTTHGLGALDLFGLGDPRLGRAAARPVVFVASGALSTAAAGMADAGASINLSFAVAVSNQGDASRGLRRADGTKTLLESLFASPPASDGGSGTDPVGLGGSTVSVPVPIDATILSVKADHERRVGVDVAQATPASRAARAALFGTALGAMLLSHLLRRRVRSERTKALRLLGMRRRSSMIVSAAVDAVDVVVGLVVGVAAAAAVGALSGRFSTLDPSVTHDVSALSQALAFTASAAIAPAVLGVVWMVLPRWAQTSMRSLGRRRGSLLLNTLAGSALLVVGVFIGMRHRSEIGMIVGGLIAIVGLTMFGRATFLRLGQFGTPASVRPALRARALTFGFLAAASGLVVLPLAASAGLNGGTLAQERGPWRSVVNLDDETDSVGLLRQLVRAVELRVLHEETILVEGGNVADASSAATMSAAADGQGDGWIPGFTSPAGSTVTDVPTGSVIVSRRLATLHPGGLKPGDRVVLRDVLSGRSVEATVGQVESLPSWAGDVATSIDMFTNVRGSEAVLRDRSAVGVSTASVADLEKSARSLAPTSTLHVRSASADAAGVARPMATWLRRVALVLLAIFVMLAIALRPSKLPSLRWPVIALAVVCGSALAFAFGRGAGGFSVTGIAVAVAGALAAAACAFHLAVPGGLRALPSTLERRSSPGPAF